MKKAGKKSKVKVFYIDLIVSLSLVFDLNLFDNVEPG